MDAVDRPIGIFDSGFGGLSVARVIRARLPQENFIYAADCGHAPWGTRPDDYVRHRAEHLAHFLLSQNVKAIVVACHTASAVVGDDLAAQLPVPVIRSAPPVREALAASRVHCIGVMATSKTVTSKSYLQIKSEALSSYPNARIVDQGCPGLMECVERGELNTPATRNLIRRYLMPILEAGADRIVLGCTHYPFLTEILRQEIGKGVEIIDPAPIAAESLHRVLTEKRLFNSTAAAGRTIFYVDDLNPQRQHVLSALISREANARKLP